VCRKKFNCATFANILRETRCCLGVRKANYSTTLASGRLNTVPPGGVVHRKTVAPPGGSSRRSSRQALPLRAAVRDPLPWNDFGARILDAGVAGSNPVTPTTLASSAYLQSNHRVGTVFPKLGRTFGRSLAAPAAADPRSEAKFLQPPHT